MNETKLMTTFAAAALALAACSAQTTDNFHDPPPTPPDTCTAIANIGGCDQGSISYACTTRDRPDDVLVRSGSGSGNGENLGDIDLVCSDGSPGGGSSTLYCCIPYSQYNTDCVPDPGITACGGVSVGFACYGAVSPSDADPTIACSAAQTGADGATDYCCNTTAIPATCAADPTVACGSAMVGYACVQDAEPTDDGAPLGCLPGTGSGQFCCATITPG